MSEVLDGRINADTKTRTAMMDEMSKLYVVDPKTLARIAPLAADEQDGPQH
jgi:hypothetical protein